MISKKKAEQKHAAKRFLERGMMDFSKAKNDLFCKFIKTAADNVTFIRKSSNRVTVWDIEYEGKIYQCIYDKMRKQIVTLIKVRDSCKKPAPVISTTPEPPRMQDIPLDSIPKIRTIFKYGVFWKTEARLKKHEDNIKKLYEKEYEKWLEDKGLFNVVSQEDL